MKRFAFYGLSAAAVLAVSLFAFSVGHRQVQRAATLRALENWDFPELVEHLNRAGLEVRIQSPRQDGKPAHNAFLTTTPRDWDDLNRLGICPGPRRIQEWRGVIYCERAGKGEPSFLHWSDHLFVVGPFAFCGDAEFLERIRAILAPIAPPRTHGG